MGQGTHGRISLANPVSRRANGMVATVRYRWHGADRPAVAAKIPIRWNTARPCGLGRLGANVRRDIQFCWWRFPYLLPFGSRSATCGAVRHRVCRAVESLSRRVMALRTTSSTCGYCRLAALYRTELRTVVL